MLCCDERGHSADLQLQAASQADSLREEIENLRACIERLEGEKAQAEDKVGQVAVDSRRLRAGYFLLIC